MFANDLTLLLHERLGSFGNYDDSLKRFESLRAYGLLPRGRANAGQRLTDEQIANAVLGFLPLRAGMAGHVSLVLGGFGPVGGPDVPIGSATTLSEALSTILSDEFVRESVIHVTLSTLYNYSSDEYAARVVFQLGDSRRTVSFVSKMACSLLVKDAELKYDHECPAEAVSRQLVLGKEFFSEIQRSVHISRELNRPFQTDWREYENEEEREEFHRRLGAKRSSHFMNIGVETQATWPKEPFRLCFEGHHLVLFPKTKDNSHSISIDLATERISADDARTLMNRFLSILAWCTDSFAVLREGWSGNPVPVPVPRRNLAFSTSHVWPFDRKLPSDKELLQRLAYYREGLNAREASLPAAEVMSFFKVFEVRQKPKPGQINETKTWIASVFDRVSTSIGSEALRQFHEERASDKEKSIENFLFENYRVASAHASASFPSDADSSLEVRRLYIGAEVMKALARYYIRVELGLDSSLFEVSRSSKN